MGMGGEEYILIVRDRNLALFLFLGCVVCSYGEGCDFEFRKWRLWYVGNGSETGFPSV